ncbi:MAG: site-specific DNA-methyltransferase [Desulfobulbaceae bacterium]|nr:site-specific DNA-methyltransferase [Desulfobulbaceae bacterium]
MNIINQIITDDYAIYHGDTVDVAKALQDDSVHFSVFSPPFETLYTYSNSARDMGNSSSSAEFWTHYKYLIAEQYRVMIPGRNVAIHCMNLQTSKQNDGFIGIRDFRGEIIRAYQEAGFIYHSEVCIWKDPVVAMQRTKALGLLNKQLLKDSAMSRQGIPDYLVVMRKPSANPEPITGPLTHFVGEDVPRNFKSVSYDDGRRAYVIDNEAGTPIDIWQRYASPIWMDISQTNTLQYRTARDSDDERHICPLQLEVIERSIQLWSNPGDVVWSPFMGIASEGYVAVQMGRKFIGAELKASYFQLAARNMADAKKTQMDLFGAGS